LLMKHCALAFAGMLLFVASFRLSKADEAALPLESEGLAVQSAASQVGAKNFFRRNRGFLPLLVGASLVFLNLSATQTYFLQIIASKGGGSMNLGIVAAIGAAVEIPMMVGFAWLSRKIRCGALVQVSALFFAVKSVAILLAPARHGQYAPSDGWRRAGRAHRPRKGPGDHRPDDRFRRQLMSTSSSSSNSDWTTASYSRRLCDFLMRFKYFALSRKLAIM